MIALSGAAVLASAGMLRAADFSWDGGTGASTSWSVGLNWTTDAPPPALSTVFFDGAVNTSPFNDLVAGTQINSIVFNTGASTFNITGNAITLGIRPTSVINTQVYDGIFNNSTNAQTVGLGLTLANGRHYFSTGTGAGSLTLTGAITRQTGATAAFLVNGGAINTTLANDATGIIGGWAVAINTTGTPTGSWATRDVSGNIVPFTAFSQTLSGSTTLAGSNAISNLDYTGNGVLTIPSGSALNTLRISDQTTAVGTIALGGTVSISNGGGIFHAFDAAANGNAGTYTISGGTLTGSAGASTMYIRTRIQPIPQPGLGPPEGTTITSPIVDNGGPLTLVKSGMGVLRLDSASSSFSGGIYLNEGQLRPSQPNSMGTGSVVVADGAEMLQGGAITQANPFFIAGYGPTEAGTLTANTFRGGALRFNSAGGILSGTITLLGDAGIGARGGQASTGPGGTVSGKITGGFGLALNLQTTQGTSGISANMPTITLTNPNNDWTGDTTIGRGRVRVGGTGEVIPDGAGKGNVIILGEAGSQSILTVDGRTETINGLNSAGDESLVFVTNSVVGQGTLRIGNNNAGGTFGGHFVDDLGVLNIEKIGNGVQTLTGSSTFTGTTTVTAGTLALGTNGGINNSKLIRVNGGAFDVAAVSGGYSVPAGVTLGGSGGAVAGNATLSDAQAIIAPGTDGTVGTLSFSNTLNLAGGNVKLDLAGTTTFGASDVLAINTLNAAGTTSLAINRLVGSLANNGTYTVATYNTFTGSLANLKAPTVRQGITVVNDTVNKQIKLVTGSGAPGSLNWTGSSNGNWNYTDTNWTGTSPNTFFDWDSVTFGNDANNTTAINIDGTLTLQPTSMTFNATNREYDIAGSGNLINVFTLTKSGTGGATLENGDQKLNTYGGIAVSGGSLTFRQFASIGSINITGGNVSFSDKSSTIAGASTLGSGAQVFVTNGSVTFNGGLTVASGGTLTNTGGDLLGSVINNGSVIFDRGDFTASTNFSGAGVINKLQGSTGTLAGDSSGFTGQLNINEGRIRVTTSSSLGSASAGTVVIANGAQLDLGVVGAAAANGLNFGTRVFRVQGSGNDDNGVITNSGTSQFNSLQKVVLTGDATFGGAATATANFARFDVRAAQVGGVNVASLDLAGHTLFKKTGNHFGLVGATVSPGNIVVNDGTLGLEATTDISGGAASGSITMNGGRLIFFGLTGNVNRPITVNNMDLMGPNNNATSTLNSSIILNNSLTLSSNLNNNAAGGTLVLNGNVSETGGARDVNVNNNGTTTFTAILNGNSSYTGSTNIQPGNTLRVNGTHTGAGAYNLNSNGTLLSTLGGSGTILGNVNAGGNRIAPGNSVGALSVNSISLDTASLPFEGDSSGFDLLRVLNSNGLTLNNTSTFSLTNLGGLSNGTYNVVTYPGAIQGGGTFTLATTAITGGGTAAMVFNPGAVQIVVSGIVGPANGTWTGATSSNWSGTGNWTGGVPNAVGATANFVSSPAPTTFSVTVDSAQTVGTINFNSATPFTIGGSSTLTLDVSSGAAAINVTGGSHTISAPVTLNDNLTVTSAASTGVALTGNLTATGKLITKAGLGSVQFENVRAGSLSITAGTAKISQKGTANSAAGTTKVTSLSISAGASLDLTNNSAIIDYTALGTTLGDVRDHLKAGRLLTSTVSPANTRIGYLDNASLGTPKTTFAGQSVDSSSVLIKFTYSGDADLDGDADGVDIGTWSTNFTGELGGGAGATRVWSQGDWDYDGDVDGVDAGLWATAFTGELGGAGLGSIVVDDPTINPQAAAILQGMGITVVPEPATVGLLGLGLAGVLARRTQRRD